MPQAAASTCSRHGALLLKVLSLAAGGFLVAAGGVGAASVAFGSGYVYFVGSLYGIAFGVIVMVVEIKDSIPLVSVLYGVLDKYTKFLTAQRGKGCFYLGVGLLICFMRPTSWEGAFSVWGVNNGKQLNNGTEGSSLLALSPTHASPAPRPSPAHAARAPTL